MPIYETKCTNDQCQHTEDRLVKINQPMPVCSVCSSPTEKQQSAQFAFGFATGGGCHNSGMSTPKRAVVN